MGERRGEELERRWESFPAISISLPTSCTVPGKYTNSFLKHNYLKVLYCQCRWSKSNPHPSLFLTASAIPQFLIPFASLHSSLSPSLFISSPFSVSSASFTFRSLSHTQALTHTHVNAHLLSRAFTLSVSLSELGPCRPL